MPAPGGRFNGCKPDVPDRNDVRYRLALGFGDGEVPFWQQKAPCLAQRRFPAVADLLPYGTWPPIYDQGNLGSCVEQAWCAAMHFVLAKEGERKAERGLSPLFLYYEVRGGVPVDTGSSIRDGIKTMRRTGACLAELWPYEERRWTEKPPEVAYANALPRRDVTYARLGNLDDMLHCLSTGYPFVGGIAIYDSFGEVDAEDPVARLPRGGESLRGWHAVTFVGYDRTNRWFKVRNSWGADWGQDGCFYLPFDYATSRTLADDFWTIRSIPVV